LETNTKHSKKININMSVKEQDFWGKEEHQQKVQQSYDTICRGCASALFE
jgi:hypothetical protein